MERTRKKTTGSRNLAARWLSLPFLPPSAFDSLAPHILPANTPPEILKKILDFYQISTIEWDGMAGNPHISPPDDAEALLVVLRKVVKRLIEHYPFLHPDDAESAAQLAILKTHRNRPEIPIPQLPRHTWFTVLTELRDAGILHFGRRHEEPLTFDPPAREPESLELPIRILDCPALSALQRRILDHRYKRGEPMPEVAKALDKPLPTVYRLHDAAIQILKAKLEAEGFHRGRRPRISL